MAKSMARIKNGIVVNIEWHSDFAPESDLLKNREDRPIAIGDTYENGKFYRNGEEVLTPLEAAYEAIEEYAVKEEELNTSYTEGVNSI